MWWKKKKDMIDLKELHGRRIHIPRDDLIVPTNKEGFVEMSDDDRPAQNKMSGNSTAMFNFLDSPATTTTAISTTSITNSEEVRKLTQRLERLDNLIYKLEQRIELLERKAGIN